MIWLEGKKVAYSAAEQCHRSQPLTVQPIQSLATWLGNVQGDVCLLLHHKSLHEDIVPTPLNAIGVPTGVFSVVLLIGPEGGFSAAEIEQAVATGFVPVQIGSLILRTETVAIAGLAVLDYWLQTSLDSA